MVSSQFSITTIVLGMLMHRHSVAAKVARQVTEACMLVGSGARSITSLAYRSALTTTLTIWIAFKAGMCCSRKLMTLSKYKLNIRGDIGHSYFMPIVVLKKSLKISFKRLGLDPVY